MKKLLLTSKKGRLGDIIAMTSGVRDLMRQYPNEYIVKVQTPSMQVWENNPNITNYEGSPDMVIDTLLGLVTQHSKSNGLHITQGTRIRLEQKLGISILQNGCFGDLHLTQEEKNNRVIKEKYWIINTEYGNQASETKRWNDNKWQEIVDKMPWITFVQTGITRHSPIVKGDNVIDMINKTNNIRELFSLFYNCEGVVCLIGGNAHMTGAFKKPAVVIAGSNEPVTFEKYPFHRYIHNIGTLPCTGDNGCWKCRLKGCSNIANGVPKCKDIISSDDVVKEIKSYYEGGKLEYPQKAINIGLNKKPIFKIVTNAQSWGGAERSSVEIMKMFNERGYDVQYSSRKNPCSNFVNEVPFAKYTNYITDSCDVFLFYASDMVFSLNHQDFDAFKNLRAKKKVMALTYRRGKVGEINWTKKGWEYMFLCSQLRDKLLERLPKAKTHILAPPVNLDKFLNIKRDYNIPITLLRYSSQGDTKYNKNINEIIENTNCNYKFMPAPSFITKSDRVITYSYNELPVDKFLELGNCGWYSLPDKYLDNGSRVMVEMLASGIPIFGDDWGGSLDRIDDSCGWICKSKEDYIKIINSLNPEILEEKGLNARKKVIKEFKKENWIKHIEGVKE